VSKKTFIFSTLVLLTGFGLLAFNFFRVEEVGAGSEHNVWGWAWSENVGWISFNCDNDYNGDGALESHCTDAGYDSDYGVNIDPSSGNFSGYAWSENIGWISFNSSELAGCPNGTCEANLNLDTKQVSGWARVLSNNSWIKLRGTIPGLSSYGISWNNTAQELEGWAWSDTDVGWVSFNCNNRGVCGTSNYKVITQLDKTPPSVSADNASSEWFSSRTVTLSASDTGDSTLDQARYYWDSNPMNSACTSGGTTFTDGAVLNVSQGSHRLYLCAKDVAGNTKTWDSGPDQYRVDATAPGVDDFTVNTISYPDTVITNTNGAIAWTVSDTGGSGISKHEVWRSPDQDTWIKIVDSAISPITDILPSQGNWWYGIHTLDNAGNCIDETGAHCGGVNSDTLDSRTVRGPIKVTYSTIAPSVDSDNYGLPWKTSDISIKIDALTNDGTDIVETRYSWGQNQMNTDCTSGGTVYSTPFTLSTGGTHDLYMCTRNQVGLTAAKERTYYLDKTPPEVIID